MATLVAEKDQDAFPAFAPPERRSCDEDGTLMDDMDDSHNNRLKLSTSYVDGPDRIHRSRSPMSASAQREQSHRLDDELLMLRAERVVSRSDRSDEEMGRMGSAAKSRSRNNGAEPVDDFDFDTTPIHEKTKVYQSPANPTTKLAKFFKKIHSSSFLVRYFCYIAPVCALLLIPLLFGLLLFKDASVGGVELFWFGIWLEIVWLTLWAARIIAKMIPWPMGLMASLFTNNSKKWRDLGKALEVPASLFFWWLAIEISFLPTMKNHHTDGNTASKSWELTTNKVIISIFVGFILNFVEKIIIQLIAISFHLRTYADRIEINKFQISSLVKLYIYSKEKIEMEDSEFEHHDQTGSSSGARTPMVYVQKAQKSARHVFTKVGDVAGKVAGDFTGRAVTTSTHPHQVILQLLNSTISSQVLARRLYRTFAREDSDVIISDDLRLAFDNDDEAESAFSMFDKDLNGDISMEELESVCVEIGRERKAITASLKDLDSVVSKLDDVFVFFVLIITILVFVSLISASASTALTSLGSTVLALSWLFSTTAQEFLQSLIFVFVKHPFDVGDRVTIYGNTGALGKGDDYFVKEISLLYTEFKKMEGHVVQAPNSYLNTLFILNQRRSGGLAEAVPVTIRFGTTLEQLEELRNALLEFVSKENREYQSKILTELTTVTEVYSITLNIVFFYKSNWQNELLRLQRRNKFICAMMVTMQDLGIEGPRNSLPGAAQQNPVYLNGAYPAQGSNFGPGPENQPPDRRSGSLARELPFVPPPDNSYPIQPLSHPSILRHRGGTSTSRYRGESLSQMGRRVDFSLGMQGNSSGAEYGDVYDPPKPHLRMPSVRASSPRASRETHSRDHDSDGNSFSKIASRDLALGRITSTASGRTHRNRFFSRGGRNKGLGTAEEGTSLDDLEAGTFGVSDMPDIPEASGSNSAATPTATWNEKIGNFGGGRGVDSGRPLGTGARIDPRSRVVSPQAMARDSALERGELPISVRRAETERVRNS